MVCQPGGKMRIFHIIWVLVLTLLLAGCGVGGLISSPELVPPGLAPAWLAQWAQWFGSPDGERNLAMEQTFAIADLEVQVNSVSMAPDHIILDLALHNHTQRDIRVFLGGCGPAQGRAHTAQNAINLYYAGTQGDELSVIPAGSVRSGQLLLRNRPGDTFVPGEIQHLELHPGYLFNQENKVQLLSMDLNLLEQ